MSSLEQKRLALLLGNLLVLALAAQAWAEVQYRPVQVSVRAALCTSRAACRVESLVAAGSAGTAHVYVARVRSGPAECGGEQQYRDWLVSERNGRIEVHRELVRGEAPCLEWHRSHWSFENGRLRFHFSGSGAPPPAGTDMRTRVAEFQPWPLRLLNYRSGSDALALPTLPARGPLFVLSVERGIP